MDFNNNIMGTNKKYEKLCEEIVSFLKLQGAKKIAIFGSYARGEAKPSSDIDILVEFKDQKSLFELVRIERELSERINIKADILTKSAISPYLIDSITKDANVVYG